MYSKISDNIAYTRKPVCAGRFYPENKNELEELIGHILESEKPKINTSLSTNRLCGAIVPHAGYIYSGYQAVHAFKVINESIEHYDTFIIINPNHTGAATDIFNLSTATKWETPLGEVEVDTQLSEYLEIEYHNAAHDNEHSGEVILPFLQYFIQYPFKIVPITMNRQNYNSAFKLAQKILKATQKAGRKVFIIASTDFSHFETPNRGYELDQLVVDQILRMNSKLIEEKVNDHNISMCGFGPVMTLIELSKLCSQNAQMHILKRGHSGTVYPSDKVVNYISMICTH